MIRRIGWIPLCLALAACGHHTDSRSAEQVVALMKASYAATQVYRDKGVVFTDQPMPWTIFKSLSGIRSLDHFSTELDRRRDAMSFVFQSVRMTGTPAEMQGRLAAIKPLSKGETSYAPSMLLGVSPQWSRLVRSEDDSVHGALCYVVHATDQRGIESTLWIEKKRFVIQRVRQKVPFEPRPYVKTFDYQKVETQ